MHIILYILLYNTRQVSAKVESETVPGNFSYSVLFKSTGLICPWNGFFNPFMILLYHALFIWKMMASCVCVCVCVCVNRSVMSDSLPPMDCRPPGSSVHEIFQARILEWVAISFSRGSSWPRDRTQSPALQTVSSSEPPEKPSGFLVLYISPNRIFS